MRRARGGRRLPVGMVLAAVLLAGSGSAAAGVSVGVERGVAEATDRNRDMRQLGLTLAVDLPWHLRFGDHWRAGWQLAARGGTLSGWGDGGAYGAGGVRLNLTAVDAGVSLEGFAGPMNISRIHFGGADFGQHWQLLTQFGFGTRVTRAVALGYRFQHMSNVGLARSNPGLDTHVFRLEVRWKPGR